MRDSWFQWRPCISSILEQPFLWSTTFGCAPHCLLRPDDRKRQRLATAGFSGHLFQSAGKWLSSKRPFAD